MDDFCDCSQCPHHCEENEDLISPTNEESTPANDSDEVSDDEDANAKASAKKKVRKLKRAIKALGFKLKDTEEGIRVTM